MGWAKLASLAQVASRKPLTQAVDPLVNLFIAK